MNKKLVSLVILTIFIMSSTICFATNTDKVTELEQNTDAYINSYEEYEQLYNEQETGYNQAQLKEYYDDYQESIKAYFKEYKRDETVKAKVVKASKVEEVYEIDEYYYSVSKYEFQPITVEILEGEHKGKTFDIDYLLTGDSLNNITYSELKTGDTIYVGFFTDEETGEIYADITNAGSNVERFFVVAIIGIVALALMMIYGGKNGVLATLITILILDFCLLIIPNMGYMGQGFIIGGGLLTILIIATISLMNFGINKKTVKASIISLIMVAIVALLLSLTSNLTRTVGITFEVAAISENVLLGNMNFESLYVIITLIVASLFITKIVCGALKKISKLNTNDVNEKINSCKELLGTNVILLTGTLLATYIPNHLLLLTNKYTGAEIWNSELLVCELIRLFVIIISMSLTIPMIALLDESKEK